MRNIRTGLYFACNAVIIGHMLEFDGMKLKKLRKERNLKQTELGLLVGKGGNHIANYENGVADPPCGTLLRLLDFFKVTHKEISRQPKKVSN